MPYQLPPELRTSKLNSLPDDLREIAEAALAEKFDIPEVTIPKKQKAPKKSVSEALKNLNKIADRPRGYPELVTIIVKSDRMMTRPATPMYAIDPRELSMSATVEMERYPYYRQQMVSIPPHMYGEEIVRLLEQHIRDTVRRMEYEGMRLEGTRSAITLVYEGRHSEINSIRDIEEFVMRYRVGDQRGRY